MDRHRIVVVDDDQMMAKVLRLMFEDAGYEPVMLSRGNQACAHVLDHDTALVILDVRLPDISGFAVCRELRARRFCGPVIFISARSDLDGKLEGFRSGADDYIVKPFEPLELLARVDSITRRFHHSDLQSLGAFVRVEDAELAVGDLMYKSDSTEAVELSPTEMQILECLMRNAGIAITRDRLMERVWGYDVGGSTNKVDVYIRRVRRKIEIDPTHPRYLHTIRGLGYVFRPETHVSGTASRGGGFSWQPDDALFSASVE